MKRRRRRRPRSPIALSPLRLSLLAALGAGCDQQQTPADAAIPDAETIDGAIDGQVPDIGGGDMGMADAAPADAVLPPPDMTLPDGAPPPEPCEGAMPIMTPQGTPSGAVRCADGALDRIGPAECEPTVDLPACGGGEQNEGDCDSDDDCTDSPHGRCVSIPVGGGFEFCGCRYGCASDADCGDGEVCICPGVVDGSSRCVPANCSTGDDCDSGECGISAANDGCDWTVRVACRAPDDACRTDADCQADGMGDICMYSNDWQCEFQAVCGRPLTVDGANRTAAATGRGDWIADGVPAPMVSHLTVAERRALAAWWTEIAALEHASVASFARATLQLMALGAPADIVADTQSGAADEVRHARLAFALASVYADRPLGPAPLPMGDVRVDVALEEAIAALVDEGCVGETLGAAEARLIADADDPAVAAVGAIIEPDETRHAGLAWRTLRWMLSLGGEAEQAAAEAAFARAIERIETADYGAGPHLPQHGLPGPDARRALHQAAVEQVIRPCAATLGLSIA